MGKFAWAFLGGVMKIGNRGQIIANILFIILGSVYVANNEFVRDFYKYAITACIIAAVFDTIGRLRK